MGLNEKARELAEILKGSREYMELKQAKSGIDANRELRNRIQEFKRREQEVLSAQSSGRSTGTKADELGRAFESLSKIPEVSRFLKAEKEFNSMVARAFKAVSDTIEASLR